MRHEADVTTQPSPPAYVALAEALATLTTANETIMQLVEYSRELQRIAHAKEAEANELRGRLMSQEEMIARGFGQGIGAQDALTSPEGDEEQPHPHSIAIRHPWLSGLVPLYDYTDGGNDGGNGGIL